MPALIVPAIMAATSAYGAYKTSKAAKAAQQQSQQQLGAASGVAGRQEGRSNELFGMGMPYAQQAGNYWQTLLGGNRAAMAQATAAPRGAITDQYRGAERGLERSGLRGGVADLAKAELSRDRSAQISSLTTGVQPMAAQQLQGLGTGLMGLGTANLSGAGNLFGNLAGLGQRGYEFQQGRSDDANAAFGRSLFDLLNMGSSAYANRGSSTLKSRQTTPNYTSWMPR